MAVLCKTQEELQLSGVVHSLPFSTETHDEDTSPDESPDTSSVVTSDTSSVEILDTSSVEAQDTSSVETQEDLLLKGVAHSLAYCKETRSLLLCDNHCCTIEQFSLSSSSGSSMQPQKLWKLNEMHGISYPTSVQIASKMNRIFIGCDFNGGIYVLDQNSLQLVKKFAQNMNRDFDYMVVDETEYPQCCTVYASSVNNDILTKFDYNSGLVTRELPVMTPSNILLKDDKLYLICGIDSSECVLVIDKHSLKIQSKFSLSGWSLLGGLCLDERGDVFVTASNDSNHRIIYSLDDGGKVVGRVMLKEFHRHAHALDMVAADKDFIILAQEPEEDFTLKRIQFTF